MQTSIRIMPISRRYAGAKLLHAVKKVSGVYGLFLVIQIAPAPKFGGRSGGANR